MVTFEPGTNLDVILGWYSDVLSSDRPCEKLFNTWSAAALLVRDSTAAAATTVHRATDRQNSSGAYAVCTHAMQGRGRRHASELLSLRGTYRPRRHTCRALRSRRCNRFGLYGEKRLSKRNLGKPLRVLRDQRRSGDSSWREKAPIVCAGAGVGEGDDRAQVTSTSLGLL